MTGKGQAFSIGGPPVSKTAPVELEPPPLAPPPALIASLKATAVPDSQAQPQSSPRLNLIVPEPAPVASTSRSPDAPPAPVLAAPAFAPPPATIPELPTRAARKPAAKKKKGKAAAALAASDAEDEGAVEPPAASDVDAEPTTQRELEVQAAAAEKAKAKPKRARAKKAKAAEGEEGEDGQPKAKKPRVTKAKGKGKAVASEGEGEGVAAPVKAAKTRKPRQKKAVPQTDEDAHMTDDEDGSAIDPGSSAEDGAERPKPKRRPRKKKADKPLFEAEDESEEDEAAKAEKARQRKLDESAALALLPDTEVMSEYLSDGSESASDGERRARRIRILRRKTTREKARITVDPVFTTMSQIATTKDLVWGRESSRGRELTKVVATRKQQRKEARERQKQKLLARARGEVVDDDEEEDIIDKGSATPVERSRPGSPAALALLANADDDEMERDARQVAAGDKGSDDEGTTKGDADEDEDDFGELTETLYVPQMRLVDGQMVIDDASLEVDRALDAQMGHIGPREVIEETARDRMVNSATWSKQGRTDKWTAEETEFFYDVSIATPPGCSHSLMLTPLLCSQCLHRFGTDFEMIAALFPLRNRRQIKAKWVKEDKLHPNRITAALMQKKDIGQSAVLFPVNSAHSLTPLTLPQTSSPTPKPSGRTSPALCPRTRSSGSTS